MAFHRFVIIHQKNLLGERKIPPPHPTKFFGVHGLTSSVIILFFWLLNPIDVTSSRNDLSYTNSCPFFLVYCLTRHFLRFSPFNMSAGCCCCCCCCLGNSCGWQGCHQVSPLDQKVASRLAQRRPSVGQTGRTDGPAVVSSLVARNVVG
jgi:hypothetical protein